ncbi:MAG: AIR synthase-related protein, partial [Alkalispirochaeta sp.]
GTLRDDLLTPTRIYAAVLADLIAGCRIAGIAHVTGGGWWENLPRLLGTRRAAMVQPVQLDRAAQPSLRLVVDAATVPLTGPIRVLTDTAVSPAEAYRTFNMGLGMALALPAAEVQRAIGIAADHGVEAWQIGTVEVERATASEAGDVPEAADAADDDRPGSDPAIEITGIPGTWRRRA